MERRTFLSLPLAAAAAVPAKVADPYRPAPFESQRISGLLGERMRVNLEGRLLRVDEEGLLGGFEQRPGKHPWIGEHVGKFLDAAVNTWRYTRHVGLQSNMDRMAERLMKTQLADGYLGTYLDRDRWTSWDVWVHKYNLLGLLAWYGATGDARALDACRRMGNLLGAVFVDGKRDLIAASTHVGMAATSLLEPVCLLYRVTGEARYLALAEHIVRSWEQPNGPKIISALTTHGRVDKTANGKAYEMMSDLVGLLELYRITGNEAYLRVPRIAQEDIAKKRRYLTGTVSSHEHFHGDGELFGEEAYEVGEGCATVTWMQLNLQLLRLTGEARYAEELERTVYNQLLAAQDPANGNICYFTPVNGRKRPGPGINCCVSSEPRGISLIPQVAWGSRGANAIAVNLYVPGEAVIPLANGNRVTVKMETRYPESGEVTVIARAEKAQKIHVDFRVPEWAAEFTVRASKRRHRGSGGYLRVEGDGKAEQRFVVNMSVAPRVEAAGAPYEDRVAVLRGPQVLAAEVQENVGIPFLHRVEVDKAGPGLKAKARMLTAKGTVEPVDVRLTPFSETRDHRILFYGAGRLRTDRPAVTAFGTEILSSRVDDFGSFSDEREETWRRTRPQKPGEPHWFGIELRSPAAIRRIVFRPGPEGRFAGTPTAEIQRVAKGAWEALGPIDGELRLAPGVTAVAVRVTGKPEREWVSCAELSAYD